MKLLIKLCTSICIVFLFSNCRALKDPIIVRNIPIENYKYVYITPTQGISTTSGGVYGGKYGVYGSSTSKVLNPKDIIAGELIKQGFILLPEIKNELKDKTIIATFGETDRRNRGLGYTIEITIQFISAQTHDIVCTCTAEGQGETEADDIRLAIRRALTSLFNNDDFSPKQ